MGIAIIAGVATGEALIPVTRFTVAETEKLTRRQIGNAGVIEEKCGDAADKKDCIENIKSSEMEKVHGIVYAPVFEEIFFRGLPSFILDGIEKREVFSRRFMNGSLGMSRRELITGVISSVVFGGFHNLTQKGIDTETIPAPQIIGSFPLWYLQRKFGTVSNVIAHAFFNFRVMNGN